MRGTQPKILFLPGQRKNNQNILISYICSKLLRLKRTDRDEYFDLSLEGDDLRFVPKIKDNTSNVLFGVDASSGTIDSRVGIGHPLPTAKLHISSSGDHFKLERVGYDVYGFKSKTIENVINISRGDVVEPHEIVSFLQDKNFKIHKLKNKFDVFEKKNVRMTLDYEEDFQFFKIIIENLQEDYTFEDILNYIDNNKSIKDINYFREVDWKNNQWVT